MATQPSDAAREMKALLKFLFEAHLRYNKTKSIREKLINIINEIINQNINNWTEQNFDCWEVALCFALYRRNSEIPNDYRTDEHGFWRWATLLDISGGMNYQTTQNLMDRSKFGRYLLNRMMPIIKKQFDDLFTQVFDYQTVVLKLEDIDKMFRTATLFKWEFKADALRNELNCRLNFIKAELKSKLEFIGTQLDSDGIPHEYIMGMGPFTFASCRDCNTIIRYDDPKGSQIRVTRSINSGNPNKCYLYVSGGPKCYVAIDPILAKILDLEFDIESILFSRLSEEIWHTMCFNRDAYRKFVDEQLFKSTVWAKFTNDLAKLIIKE